jgi:hypothetical protein
MENTQELIKLIDDSRFKNKPGATLQEVLYDILQEAQYLQGAHRAKILIQDFISKHGTFDQLRKNTW